MSLTIVKNATCTFCGCVCDDIELTVEDNHITKALLERGVQVARRTVAKYREALTIPPAHERRRLDPG